MGTEYMGVVNTTRTGLPCQNWSSQTPNEHDQYTKILAWALEENYCRNPDRDVGPWCYAAEGNIRYQYCNIPNCAGWCLTQQQQIQHEHLLLLLLNKIKYNNNKNNNNNNTKYHHNTNSKNKSTTSITNPIHLLILPLLQLIKAETRF